MRFRFCFPQKIENTSIHFSSNLDGFSIHFYRHRTRIFSCIRFVFFLFQVAQKSERNRISTVRNTNRKSFLILHKRCLYIWTPAQQLHCRCTWSILMILFPPPPIPSILGQNKRFSQPWTPATWNGDLAWGGGKNTHTMCTHSVYQLMLLDMSWDCYCCLFYISTRRRRLCSRVAGGKKGGRSAHFHTESMTHLLRGSILGKFVIILLDRLPCLCVWTTCVLFTFSSLAMALHLWWYSWPTPKAVWA